MSRSWSERRGLKLGLDCLPSRGVPEEIPSTSLRKNPHDGVQTLSKG